MLRTLKKKLYSKVIEMYFEGFMIIIVIGYVRSQEVAEGIETMYLLILLPLEQGNVRLADVTKIGAHLAKHRIEMEKIIDPTKYSIRLDFRNDACDATVAAQSSLLDFIDKATTSIRISDSPWYVSAVIGMTCNQVCRPIGSYYGIVYVSVISIGCQGSIFSYMDEDDGYPTFARVGSSSKDLVDATVKLIQYHCWKNIAVITQSDTDWFRFSSVLKKTFDQTKIISNFDSIISYERIQDKITNATTSYIECKAALLILKGSYNYFVLLAQDAPVLACLLAANDIGMTSSNALFIAYGYSVDRYGAFWPDEDIERVYLQDGLISINVWRPDAAWEKFKKEFYDYYEIFKDAYSSNPEEMNLYSGLLYDAVLFWAYAVNKSMEMTERTPDGFLKEDVPDFFNKAQFDGATGSVIVNADGDRLCDYSVEMVTKDMDYIKMFHYNHKTATLEDSTGSSGAQPYLKAELNLTELYAKSCSKDKGPNPGWIAMAAAIVFAFLFMLIIIFIFYRKTRRETEMKAVNAWIIRWDDVATSAPGKEHLYTAAVKRILLHEVSRVTFGADTADTQKQEKYSDVGYYKGVIVSIKPVERRSIEITDNVMLGELRNMINLKHENLNLFVGVCLDEPNICMLTQYAKHGSLHNVLMDDDVEVPLEFKLSFAIDISKGMEYLHTTVLGSHGHLSSTNCVVDKKWTCKITDYGMGEFQKMRKRKELENASNQLWTAPELLRLVEDERPLYGSPKGDVYSYGIILQELACRKVPFAIERKELATVDILAKIAILADPPFRPAIPDGSCTAEWRKLMTNCWKEEPDERPNFKKITVSVRKMGKGRTINIIDNMMEKLEKHTQHLEELVAERTNELNAEKRKVESLLYNILPKSVAESLLRHGYVDPEMFESVTIYFSDIVGFIKIGQNSTAYQVVDLLNVLYSKFDEITDKYEVYKCETIGDVYMVASGLPVRNGERHAPEITTMALHLLSAISSFEIPHMPGSILQLRIGLHTGSVVAGVVGLKMPHYCLFGDTVNTASRMQSGGLALRIHISSVTAEILNATGVFILELRGDREVKGKGIMTTYWVLGKKGFDMPMPDLSKAAKPEEHDFK